MSKLPLLVAAALVGAAILTGVATFGVSFAESETPAPQPKRVVAQAAQAGQAAQGTSKQFGGWVLTCPQDAGGRCVLFQQVSEALSRKVVFIWLVQYNDKGELVGAFTLPSGVFIKPGIVLKTGDDKPSILIDYTRCDPAECQAVFPIGSKLIQQLSPAKKATVELALTNGNTASVSLDMSGFVAGLAALGQKAPKAQQ